MDPDPNLNLLVKPKLQVCINRRKINIVFKSFIHTKINSYINFFSGGSGGIKRGGTPRFKILPQTLSSTAKQNRIPRPKIHCLSGFYII